MNKKIYVRTPFGNQEVRFNRLGLDRKRRTLLMLFDGKTDVGTLKEAMSSLGEIDILIMSLKNLRLIEECPHSIAYEDTMPNDLKIYSSDEFEGRRRANQEAKRVFSQLIDRIKWYNSPSEVSQSAQKLKNTSISIKKDTVAAVIPTESQVIHQDTLRLKAAIGEIAIFLSNHYPGRYGKLMMVIGNIKSIDHLRKHVGAYYKLIKHIGQSASDHYCRLKVILDI